jgi:hypothetical protein
MKSEPRPITSANLTRWLDSGDPYRWVWRRSAAWSEQDFAEFLDDLRAGPYWPLNEAKVRQTLEAATATYRDLERWGLLTKHDAEDDDIFF